MSERTVETVRAELEEVRQRLRTLEVLNDAIGQCGMSADFLFDQLDRATPVLGEYASGPVTRQAAAGAVAMRQIMVDFLHEFGEPHRVLQAVLQGVLFPRLQKQISDLQRELAVLEPLEVGFWQRWKRGLLKFLDAWPAWWEIFAKET